MRHNEAAVISLNEAAVMVGKGDSTVRLWLKNGVVQGHKDSNGCWAVERNSLLAHVAIEGGKKPQRKIRGAESRNNSDHIAPSAEPASDLVIALREALSRERQLLDDSTRRVEILEARIAHLERERTQHLAEMRALLSKDPKATDGVLSRWLRR